MPTLITALLALILALPTFSLAGTINPGGGSGSGLPAPGSEGDCLLTS